MKVEAPYDIEAYIKKTQELNGLDDIHEILEYIDSQKKMHEDSEVLLNLFRAEEAFYMTQYKIALKHYLKAKTIPYFEFFCFRASAYASEEMSNYLKAIKFAKKALQIQPEDPPTLAVLARTYISIDQRDKAQTIHKKLEGISHNNLPPEPKKQQQEDMHHFIPVGEQELEELSKIFSTKEPEQTNLFASELPEPVKHTYEKDTSTERDIPVEADLVVFPPGCDLFSHSPKPWESEESLTKRLYETSEASPPPINAQEHDSMITKHNLPSSENINPTNRNESTSTQKFLTCDYKQLEDYHQLYRRQTCNKTNFILSNNILHTAPYTYPIRNLFPIPQNSFLIHWQGHGIAVNPGKNFLENIHYHSLFLQDIQSVIVTEATPHSLEELNKLFTLSSKLSELHLATPITFYVHSALYDNLKRKWPNHLHLYSLVKDWNINDTIHCSTCLSDQGVCGINLQCSSPDHDLSITYFHQKPKHFTPTDILIMEASDSHAEYILAMNPKVTILYDTSATPARDLLQNIRNLRSLVLERNQIIPATDCLLVHLKDLLIETGHGEWCHDVSELCAVAVSNSTIQLVPKETMVMYTPCK